MRQRFSADGEKLQSWKVIAAFFGREVRTVQLWEKHEGLPIHRHLHSKQGRVFAYRTELETWRRGATLIPERRAFPPSFISSDGAAADAYGLARFLWGQRTMSSLRRAETQFRRAIDLDPKFSAAYAGLADCMVSYSVLRLMTPREAADAANLALQALLALPERTDMDSLNGVANVMVCCNWNWSGGERYSSEACQRNPQDSRALQIRSAYMSARRRHPDAIRYAVGAVRLDPYSKALNLEAGFAHYFAGDYDAAMPYASRMIEIDPDFAAGHALLGRIESERGNWEIAARALQEAAGLAGNAIAYRALLAYAFAKGGDRTLGRRALAGVDVFEASLACPVAMAAAQAQLGETDSALRLLATAREQRDSELITLASDPRFAALRRRSGFREVIHSLGLN